MTPPSHNTNRRCSWISICMYSASSHFSSSNSIKSSSSMALSPPPLIHHALLSLALLLLLPSSSSNLTDKEALLSVKFQIAADPTNTLSSWNDSLPTCQWRGVTCNRHGRVSTLDLRGLGLSGSISPRIGNLSALRYLYLQENNLSGELPNQLGCLIQLKILNTSSNLIQGAIPLNITMCADLEAIDLSANRLSDRIPAEIGVLSKLQVLNLGQNQLAGSLPRTIGNLSSLITLNVLTNTLSGPIPDELSNLTRMEYLQLSINNLTGTVPPSLYNLSSLVTFALASNNLSGEIPGDVGFRLPKLLVFHFCFNMFTGQYPASLHNLTKIQSIRLSHLYLTGSIPPGLGNLHDLIMYNIGYNQIVDGLDFVTSLTNSTQLRFLAFDGNIIKGSIPESIGNLSASLGKLYMGGNQIYGSVPASIGQLTSLTLLNMSHNFLSEEIPLEIGRLKELRMLGLAGNKISGGIPVSLGNLSQMTELEMYGNELAGPIPASFGGFQNLLSLDLSSNKLEGRIPSVLFSLTSLASLLNLSHNSLLGPIPEEIGMLENLVVIDLSSNSFSGNVSDSIGYCKSLQALSMANNALTGQIPDTIGNNLKGLQSLDLSSNDLTGSIPQSLANLQALQSLNLSFNNLEGDVPGGGVFRNLSSVHLQGNSKLCLAPPCHGPRHSRHRKLTTPIITAIALSAFILVVSVSALFWVLITKRASTNSKVTALGKLIKWHHRLVSYAEICSATDNFNHNNLIGAGSFGSVYRGALRDGMMVAIKVLNLGIIGASKSFMAECEALRNVRHRNLLKLVTLCSSMDFANKDFLALVYEFMGHGSLEDWIRGRKSRGDGKGLSVSERLDIAIDVASAMDYLHNDCEAPVVHCDLKPSNVLIDENMSAKIGDFGLARLLVDRTRGAESITSTHGLKGSIGYIPPEYGIGGSPSSKGDVYSYGVMLLELVTGKSPTDESFVEGLTLEKWVRASFPDGAGEIVDAQLNVSDAISYKGEHVSPEKQLECAVSMLRVGLSCAVESPEARSNMRKVLRQLKGIREALVKP